MGTAVLHPEEHTGGQPSWLQLLTEENVHAQDQRYGLETAWTARTRAAQSQRPQTRQNTKTQRMLPTEEQNQMNVEHYPNWCLHQCSPRQGCTSKLLGVGAEGTSLPRIVLEDHKVRIIFGRDWPVWLRRTVAHTRPSPPSTSATDGWTLKTMVLGFGWVRQESLIHHAPPKNAWRRLQQLNGLESYRPWKNALPMKNSSR